jgi:hypothetical protein
MAKYFSCVLIGDWGTGKTTAAATAPKPVLYIDVDNKLHKMENLAAPLAKGDLVQWPITEPLGTISLKRLAGTKLDEGRDKFPVPRPKGFEQISDMVEKLVNDKCIVNGKKIETVVLDSYTSLNEHSKALILAANGSMAMSQPLWGVQLRLFEQMHGYLLGLPANIIFICHEAVDKDDITGRISIKPLIDGSMKNKIGKDFEEVYFMQRTIMGKEVRFKMLPWGDSMRQGRTSRALPIEVDPDFGKLYHK